MRDPVKGKTDAGRRREARALLTRRHIVEAGLRLFSELGYTHTTVKALADAAGVAPATVYQAFGTKQAVLAAALDVAITGDAAPRALLDRPWVQQVRDEPDVERRLRLVVDHTAEVAARTAAIKEVLRDAAAIEPELRELIEQDHARRRATQAALVSIILDTAPDDPRVTSAADLYFALVNSDTYRLLVGHLGWTYEQWRDWLYRQLRRELVSM